MGMGKTTILRVRIEIGRKKRAEKILGHYGLTPAQAINVFYAKVSEVNGLPFVLRIEETDEFLADPDFKTHLARLKMGQVRYRRPSRVPA